MNLVHHTYFAWLYLHDQTLSKMVDHVVHGAVLCSVPFNAHRLCLYAEPMQQNVQRLFFYSLLHDFCFFCVGIGEKANKNENAQRFLAEAK